MGTNGSGDGSMGSERVVILEGIHTLTYAAVERIAYHGTSYTLSNQALQDIDDARRAYEEAISKSSVYAYGHNTDPGNRAKVVKTLANITPKRTFGEFVAMRPGATSGQLPDRVVRLALLFRLVNTLAGVGRLSSATAQALVDLQDNLPVVPRCGLWASGEVMSCGWLLSSLRDLPILPGEGMALINGSPFGSAFSFDAARLSRRRLNLCQRVLAFSFEKASAPLQHIDTRLGALWPVPEYCQALESYSELLTGGVPDGERLHHQAPTCFRVIPNHTAIALEAVAALETLANINITAVKDNPNLVPHSYDILSSAGYHDNFAARKIDNVNAAFADLVTIIAKQVNHFLAGSSFHRPLYFGRGQIAGVEWLAWTLNDAVRIANEAAKPTGLSFGEDPGGNQSDIVSPVFATYEKHRQVTQALDDAMAVLLLAACLSGDETAESLRAEHQRPPQLRRLSIWLSGQLGESLAADEPALLVSEPLRGLITNIKEMIAGEGSKAVLLEDIIGNGAAYVYTPVINGGRNGMANGMVNGNSVRRGVGIATSTS